MSELAPVTAPSIEDRSLVARHAGHDHPFIAELRVDATHLSRLIPHVNNVEYLRWVDRVAELHADALGYTREALLGEDRCFFVARHEVDYLAECWMGDRLLVATWVRSMRKTTSWRDTVILRPATTSGGDDVVIARAATLWAFVDLSSRRPARIEAAMIDRFAPSGRSLSAGGTPPEVRQP